jgi:transcriptional regulator with XRE-family HTH domain
MDNAGVQSNGFLAHGIPRTLDRAAQGARNDAAGPGRSGRLQIRRYEGGTSRPTLDVIKRLAQALRVSADALVFDAAERGPDEELKFQFEAVARMPNKEKEAIRTMLEAMIVKNQVAGVLEGVAKAGSR